MPDPGLPPPTHPAQIVLDRWLHDFWKWVRGFVKSVRAADNSIVVTTDSDNNVTLRVPASGAPVDATYATVTDESAVLINSRQLAAGANISLTDGGPGSTLVIAATASGAPVGASYVVMGLDGTLTNERVLTAGSGISITDGGAGNPVTIAATGGGGALVLLEQHTAAASATLDFTAWYSSTYDDYLIEVVNVIAATTATSLQIQFSTNGGSSYDTGNNYGWSTLEWSQSGSGVSGTSPTNAIVVARNFKTTAGYSMNGRYMLANPGGANFKQVVGSVSVLTNVNIEGQHTTGVYRITTAVNAFRALMSSGNIASGTIRVYGLTK